MIASNSQGQLGAGIYTPAQAAFLARLSPRTMSAWLAGEHGAAPRAAGRGGGGGRRPGKPATDGSVVTFLDLVQAMAVRAIRLQRRIPLDEIRDFARWAQEEHGLSHPFARAHRTYLLGSELVLRVDGEGESPEYLERSGRRGGQRLMREIVETYLDDLSFGADRLACRYTPLRDGSRCVLLDPRHRLGQPLVMPVGVSVGELVAAVAAEGSVKGAARVHDIDPADVRLALRYHDALRGVAA